jgi:hypothetical protein
MLSCSIDPKRSLTFQLTERWPCSSHRPAFRALGWPIEGELRTCRWRRQPAARLRTRYSSRLRTWLLRIQSLITPGAYIREPVLRNMKVHFAPIMNYQADFPLSPRKTIIHRPLVAPDLPSIHPPSWLTFSVIAKSIA